MKIAISICYDLSNQVGTTVRAQNIFSLLSQKYCTFLIERADNETDFDHVITIKPKGTKLWSLKLIPVILKHKPDCVICVNDYAGFLTFYLLSKLYKFSIIFDAQSIFSTQFGLTNGSFRKKLLLRTVRGIEEFVMRHSAYVLVASTAAGNFYKRYNENIAVVKHFVDENLFHATERALESKRSREHKLIGLIGPYDSQDKLQELNFLFEYLHEFNEGLKFTVIGRCLRQIHEDRISYTGYLEKPRDYIDHVAALDAALILQNTENFGPLTRILEAMACSVPVFTVPYAIKGLDAVRRGRDLFVFEYNELAAGVNDCIVNDDLMKRVAANGRKYVENYHGKKSNEDKLLAVLHQCIPDR